MKLVSTNPAKNYEYIGEVEISTPEEISYKVAWAQKAKKSWRNLWIEKRILLLEPILKSFQEKASELATLISQEVGKPISEAKVYVDSYNGYFQWCLQNSGEALSDEITHQDADSIHTLSYEPYGVACVISPWNFPYGMAVWGIIPNLLAGNTVVFKISEECPLVGKFIEEVFWGHELPLWVFSEVYGDGSVGKILSESDIDILWFTGSSKVGQKLYKTAAEKFIPAVLEMWGSNPCIVFDDVDIEKTAEIIYEGRFENCGQVCDAIKRLIVHENIHDQLVDALVHIIQKKRVWDPSVGNTDLWSLVAKRQQELLISQVTRAKAQWATTVTWGKAPTDMLGAFYEPTLLTNVSPDMDIWSEEVFWPVLSIISFQTEQEAIELANDTQYGLGARVMSQNIERTKRVAKEIDAGTVEVNSGSRWLHCNPFWGFKKSGLGREHGTAGFRQLCQIKVTSVGKK